MITLLLRKRKSALIIIIAIIIAISVILLANYKTASAVPGLPFGGLVFHVTLCTCGIIGAVVFVGPPVGGLFKLVPSTLVFPFGRIPAVNVWLLGDYFPGGSCFILSGKGCVPNPEVFPGGGVTGIINFVGTSQ